MHWLLVSSDPMVTEARGWPKLNTKEMSEDAKTLLVQFEQDSGEKNEE